MRVPVSDGMLYAPKLSTCVKRKRYYETGNEEGSTTGVKQTKNFIEQRLTIGLDLGDRSSWYCVLDGCGSVLLEQRLSTTRKAMQEVFGGTPAYRTGRAQLAHPALGERFT